ncbi:MAG: hypothetical protein KBD01_18380 [Acidobacteria bacterium]|nr:hypothetical protein [Acidobacteriota bacterium]
MTPTQTRSQSIPAVMIRFLDNASVALAGSRDADLVPHVHRLSGWAMEQDGQTMLCLVARGFTDGLAERLQKNGQFSATVEVISSHETHQFKGHYIDSRPANAGDRELVARCTERFVAAVRQVFGDRFSVESLRTYIPEAALAVRFRVREIYVQTPGPAAGQRLFPLEDPLP